MASVAQSVPAGRTWRMVARKYLNIFRASLVERMAYRSDFLLGTVLRFLPVLTTILLWEAIYAGRKKATGDDYVAEFDRREMIAYLLLIHISRMFSSMPGLAAGITRDVREGTLKKYLVQPLDMIGYLVSYRAAHKTAYITTSFLPYAGLFAACYSYFDSFPDALTFAAYLLSLVLGFLVGFFFEVCIGMISFWVLEVTSLLWIIATMNYFVSGQMFPLDILPSGWQFVLKALPFQYMAYFPAVVFLGKVEGANVLGGHSPQKVPGPDLATGLLIEAAWALGLMLLARFLYNRGLRRYSAFGG